MTGMRFDRIVETRRREEALLREAGLKAGGESPAPEAAPAEGEEEGNNGSS